jgi:hypothetical protein
MEIINFTCTSDGPYDRHNYEVVLKNGKKVFFEFWEDCQVYWWENCKIPDFLDLINVLDKKKLHTKGFGN